MNVTNTTIRTVRGMMPARALTLSEAYVLAEQQAMKLLQLLKIHEVPVDVARLAKLPKIEVRAQPRHRMPTLSGFTQWTNGRWLIVINRNNSEGRRRFTLAHEFKHVLDHNIGKVAYARLGGGSKAKRERQIEQVCDYFAACLLMPGSVVKRAWYHGIQDVPTLATHFKVSFTAMRIRLAYLGYLDDERPIESYFRSNPGMAATYVDTCWLIA